MDARPLLADIGSRLQQVKLEAVLIGNAAAALQGAPVTTIDSVIEIDGVPILVASLADVIRSKKAARRPRDLAVLEILEKALEETNRQKGQARGRRARK